MFTFLVQDMVGFTVIKADSYKEAYLAALIVEQNISDYYAFDGEGLRQKLLADGYKTMNKSTEYPTVFMLTDPA